LANDVQHLAALGISTAAGDGAAVFRALALALAAAQVEFAHLNAVAHAAAGAVVVAQGFAKALQFFTVQRIIATARDPESTDKLLKRKFARHRVQHVHLRRFAGELGLSFFGQLSHHISGHKSTLSNEVLSAGLLRTEHSSPQHM
jgi:hypothetical protein